MPLSQRDTIQRATVTVRSVREQLFLSQRNLNVLLNYMPTGPLRNNASEINIDMLRLHDRVTDLMRAIDDLSQEVIGDA